MENNQKEIILLKDLGMQFATEKSKVKNRYGLFKCFCGKEFKAMVSSIKSENAKSCGCLRNSILKYRNKNILSTHNMSNHRLYNTWRNMIHRCTNVNHKDFKDYGGRGIAICDEWFNINKFIEDMFPSYEDGLTLDRENTNGNYEKENCRWVTMNIQKRNTRKIRINNKSGYRGVSWCKGNNKWVSQITINNKVKHLGYFNNSLDGAKVYDNYIIDNNLEHTKNFS